MDPRHHDRIFNMYGPAWSYLSLTVYGNRDLRLVRANRFTQRFNDKMKKTLLIAISCLVAASSSALACTQEEATKKATDLQTAMVAYLQKNPDKAQQLMAKSQEIGTKYQKATSFDEACQAYDELLSSLK